MLFCSDVRQVAEHMRSTFAAAAASLLRPDPTLHTATSALSASEGGSQTLFAGSAASGADARIAGSGDRAVADQSCQPQERPAAGIELATTTVAAQDVAAQRLRGTESSHSDPAASCVREGESAEGEHTLSAFAMSAGRNRKDVQSDQDSDSSGGDKCGHATGAAADPASGAAELEWAKAGWLEGNPLPVPTERELHATERDRPTWRMVLVKAVS